MPKNHYKISYTCRTISEIIFTLFFISLHYINQNPFLVPATECLIYAYDLVNI
jgi:hypothetical protein